ncbi:MAG: MFS transporter [Candidatus Bathyarchaeia archaeon]
MMRYPRVYFVLITNGFMLIFGYSMLRSFLANYARQLDPTGILAGFTISSYFFARTFIELPSGFISDRIGRRKPIVLGMLLGALGAIVCSLSSVSIYFLIIGLMVWGLGAALVFTNNMALIIDLFEPKVRGRALGNFQGIEFIGSFAGAPIGGFLAELFLGHDLGYAAVFYVIGASIFAAFLAAYTSKELKETSRRPREGSTGPSFRETLRGLKNWGLLITCTVSFLRMFIMMGVFSTIFPIYLEDVIRLSEGPRGIVFGARTGG